MLDERVASLRLLVNQVCWSRVKSETSCTYRWCRFRISGWTQLSGRTPLVSPHVIPRGIPLARFVRCASTASSMPITRGSSKFHFDCHLHEPGRYRHAQRPILCPEIWQDDLQILRRRNTIHTDTLININYNNLDE
jgi:hypothetical protein